MTTLSYHKTMDVAADLHVPDSSVLSMATAPTGHIVDRDWNHLFSFMGQIDLSDAPDELLVHVRQFSHGVCHLARAGGIFGPVATDEVAAAPFGSLGNASMYSETDKEYLHVPFDMPTIDRLVELLENYRDVNPDGFERYAKGFLVWLQEKRQ